jgi:SNF2 family DNA or RNA helicase
MQLMIYEPQQWNLFEPNQLPIFFPIPMSRLDEIKALEFADGRRPYPYQAENGLFFEQNGFRCICADGTGLGKTLSALLPILMNREKMLQLLVFCKTTLKIQFLEEIFSALGIYKIQILTTASDFIDTDAEVWIISYDLAKRKEMLDNLLENCHPQFVILDECQQIKNWDSNRTQSIVKLCAEVPYVLGTSATPISNNLEEFFPMLHICRPERFPNKKLLTQMMHWVTDSNGKVRKGGISPYYEKHWRALTEDIIIRHNREDVAPDLPTVVRQHRYVKIEDKGALDAYVAEMEKYVQAYDGVTENSLDSDTISYAESRRNLGASLMRLRHLVGDIKIPYAIDFIEEFLNDNPEKKLTVFVHHKSVAEGIMAGVKKLREEGLIDINEPFVLRGGMNEAVRNDLISKCTQNGGWPSSDPLDRLMIASTQAAGEGINLQLCFDAIMVERQFNPPKEEQPEGRFSRQGEQSRELREKFGIKNIFIVYLTLMGTLDGWFNNIVEMKRKELKRVHGDKDFYGGLWGDTDEIVTDFMDLIAEQGRKLIKSVNKTKRKLKKGEVAIS